MADAVGLALEAVILRLSLRDLANDALYADKVRWLLSRLPRGTRCAPIDLPPSFWRVPIPHVNAFRQTWHMPVARAATTRFFCGAVGGHPVRTRKRRAVGHQPAVADRGGAARRPAAGTGSGRQWWRWPCGEPRVRAQRPWRRRRVRWAAARTPLRERAAHNDRGERG